MPHSSPPRLVFTPHFLKIVVEVTTWGPPHLSKLWLWVSKGMLPVIYFCYDKASFCVSQMLLRLQGCLKDEVILATLTFGDITGFKTEVFVCYY